MPGYHPPQPLHGGHGHDGHLAGDQSSWHLTMSQPGFDPEIYFVSSQIQNFLFSQKFFNFLTFSSILQSFQVSVKVTFKFYKRNIYALETARSIYFFLKFDPNHFWIYCQVWQKGNCEKTDWNIIWHSRKETFVYQQSPFHDYVLIFLSRRN